MMPRESAGAAASGLASPGAGPQAPPGERSVQRSIQFNVRYSLGEYTLFMWQHSSYLIRRRKFSGPAAWWMAARSTWSAAFNFFVQRRSRHVYEFTVDDHGVVRTNSAGVTLVPWSDVIAIRRYTGGFMMVLQRGTLPIPYRCLDEQQKAVMGSFAETLRATNRQ
ncbi:MAG: YcxB family protein [Gammaproteobacteria bacterium]